MFVKLTNPGNDSPIYLVWSAVEAIMPHPDGGAYIKTAGSRLNECMRVKETAEDVVRYITKCAGEE